MQKVKHNFLESKMLKYLCPIESPRLLLSPPLNIVRIRRFLSVIRSFPVSLSVRLSLSHSVPLHAANDAIDFSSSPR